MLLKVSSGLVCSRTVVLRDLRRIVQVCGEGAVVLIVLGVGGGAWKRAASVRRGWKGSRECGKGVSRSLSIKGKRVSFARYKTRSARYSRMTGKDAWVRKLVKAAAGSLEWKLFEVVPVPRSWH